MKTRFSKKVLALMLAFALVVPMFVLTTNAAETEVTFEFGANGTASHADGSEKATYSETVDGYTLNITSGSKMYTAARDAKGNSCLKLGTSSAIGSFTFTVPDDVTEVVIYAAQYKANSSELTVNGTTTTLSKASNDGEYDAITVDTSESKTVSVSTTSSKKRAMVNAIVFNVGGGSAEPEEPQPSVSVSGATNTLIVGDSIELVATATNVSGTIEWSWSSSNDEVAAVNSNGLVATKGMGKVTITADVNGTQGTYDINVYPIEGSALTVEEALLVCEMTGTTNCEYTYSVVGVIESIDTPYDSGFKNITVTISDGTGSIKAFRMAGGSDLAVGDTITVTGILVNYGGNTPEFVAGCTYEKPVNEEIKAIREALNEIAAKMQLAYQYKAETSIEEIPVTSEVTDIIDYAFTGVSGSSYVSWADKVGNSGATYAGNSYPNSTKYIQLRSSSSNSGIVTTASGGNVKSITIVWNSKTTSSTATLDVYGSNTAYNQATALYSTSTQGTKIGSIVNDGSSTTLTVSGDYQYIGLRSKSGAIYLDSISITWAAAAGETKEEEVTTYSDSEFVIRCGVDAGLVEIENVDSNSYGIKVTAGGKSVVYTYTASSWVNDGTRCYVTISLGDIINDVAKLGTEFTVAAVVTVDGVEYASTDVATYSVATMIEEYNGMEDVDVSDLYGYLVKKGLIVENA